MVIVKTESGKMETVTVKTEMVEDCDDPDEESETTPENCPVFDIKTEVDVDSPLRIEDMTIEVDEDYPIEDMKIEVEEWSPTSGRGGGAVTRSSAFKIHRMGHHARVKQEPEPSSSSTKPSRGKRFACTVCGKRFAEKRDLERHCLIHSGIKPHACDVC